MLITSFEELECWKSCRTLRLFITHEVMPPLPKEERHRLGDQRIRAARSTTANIAERHGRFHHMDKAKFCSNARGSCREVLDHLITANDETLITTAMLNHRRDLVATAIRVLNGWPTSRGRPTSPNNQ